MRISDYINELPDSYKKGTDSNNYKLLYLEERLVCSFRTDVEAVQETLDITKARGKTLDLYGAMYGQARGSLTDEQYRVAILQRVSRYLSGSDYNSTVNALASALGVSPTEIKLVEEFNPMKITVSELPYTILQNAGITSDQISQIIEALMPVGVPLGNLEVSGTFEFGTTNNEYDENKGFGGIGTAIGGYFGLVSNNDSTPLPT